MAKALESVTEPHSERSQLVAVAIRLDLGGQPERGRGREMRLGGAKPMSVHGELH